MQGLHFRKIRLKNIFGGNTVVSLSFDLWSQLMLKCWILCSETGRINQNSFALCHIYTSHISSCQFCSSSISLLCEALCICKISWLVYVGVYRCDWFPFFFKGSHFTGKYFMSRGSTKVNSSHFQEGFWLLFAESSSLRLHQGKFNSKMSFVVVDTATFGCEDIIL